MTQGAAGQAFDIERAIRGEIAASGPMTFARFMEICLFHPEHGYYTRGLGGGGGRDYVTSSGLHAAYGTLLARQAEEMWRLAGRPDEYHFVELGPGEGYFACDFLRAAAGAPAFAHARRYVLVETSPELQRRQQRLLGSQLPAMARSAPGLRDPRWADLADLERRGVPQGCLFANEVLDAFPVHRIACDGDVVREIHVDLVDGELRETPGDPSTPDLAAFLSDAGVRLAPGQETVLCLEAPRFVERLARLLGRGYLVCVDYGYLAADLYHPARRRGTLLAYHRHRISEDVLARPGEQDLTAHVDFSAAARAAERGGMRLAGLTSQARFLLALGALDLMAEADVRQKEAMKEMVLPDRMGGVFRVLVMVKGDLPASVRGLSAPWADPTALPPVRAERAV